LRFVLKMKYRPVYAVASPARADAMVR